MSNLTKSKISVAAITVAVIGTALFGASANAWGPTRDTYTWQVPSDHVTFNSITDDKYWGDERGFTVIKDLGTDLTNDGKTAAGKITGEIGTNANTPNVVASKSDSDFKEVETAHDGHYYMIKMLVHNNASSNLNLTAKDTNIGAYIDKAYSKAITIQTDINASNCGANTKGNKGSECWFWDEAYIKSADDDQYKAEYVKDSLRYYNNVKLFSSGDSFTFTGDNDDSNLLKSQGVKIGYDKMDGNIPGCSQYMGFATFIVKVSKKDSTDTNQPNYIFYKRSRIYGTESGGWSTQTVAKPGDTIEFQIGLRNIGKTTLTNPILQDTMGRTVAFKLDSNRNGNDPESTDKASYQEPSNSGAQYHLVYNTGSSKFQSANHNSANGGALTLTNDNWGNEGIKVSSLAPCTDELMEQSKKNEQSGDDGRSLSGADKYSACPNVAINYTMTVPSADKMPCGTVTYENVALAYTSENDNKLSTSRVTVQNDDEHCIKQDTPTPTNGASQPGAPTAGTTLAKAAVASTVALGVCAVILVRFLLKRKESK